MVWVGEEYVVEPNGWVDERYVDPAFSLLPVQPPKVNPLSLPRPKHYLKPVTHKLHYSQWQRKCTHYIEAYLFIRGGEWYILLGLYRYDNIIDKVV